MNAPAAVLLVNDETPAKAVEAFAAAARSFDVHTADTIPEALDIVAGTDIDCVVSDFEVPDAEGREFRGAFHLLEALREETDIPFVLFSRLVNEDIARDAIEAGIAGYLDRSVGYDRLVWRVDRVVESRQVGQRAARQARIVDVMRDVNRCLVRAEDHGELEHGVLDRLTDLETYSTVGFTRADGADAEWTLVGDAAEYVPPPEDIDAVERALTTDDQTLAVDLSGTPWADEAGIRTLVAVPVRFEDTCYGVVAVFADEPDAVDETEQSLLADLGENVGHALHTLDVEASLRDRERQLADQNRHLERFVDIVSHDLRNPLSVARGNVELQREHGAGDLDATARALERMSELLDDMLTLARQRSVTVTPTDLDLAAAAESAWESVETPGATLRAESDVTVEADGSRLRQLLENLFRNSVEHGSTGSRSGTDDSVEHGGDGVTVTVGALDDGAGFFVADDGSGIDDGDAKSVFDPGYSTNPDGTGLGLDIVSDVADAHGWTVTLTDSEAGGACFEVRTD